MTVTCNDIIGRALRMARIVALGDEPQLHEAREGLIVLQSFYSRLAETALAPCEDRYETEDYEALENERIFCDGTVALPEIIDDGISRRPYDLAAIAYNDQTTATLWQTWISDRGDWIRIDDLELTDSAPFATRNQEGLSALVAVELAETFGSQPTPGTAQKARRFQSLMQPKDLTDNEYY